MSDRTKPAVNSETMYDDAPLTTVRDYAEVTPSDVTEFTPYFRALRIGSIGDVAVTTIRDEAVTFVNVQNGEVLPVWVKQVLATGTTATDIVGFYG